MSNLNIDQKSILDFFSNKKNFFLIPDYQRPYAWTDENGGQCDKLWQDIFDFAFPNNGSGPDATIFDSDKDEYFLGPIVSFKNEQDKLEIIDGQQRLTTLMLLLRAFYDKFEKSKDPDSQTTRDLITKCIWKTNEFDKPDMETLKIDSEVATDGDKQELIQILKTGNVEGLKSRYAKNYKFFLDKIQDFLADYPSYFAMLPIRIMRNCILLPIEAGTQDDALRIFSTLNDRGLTIVGF